jgi:IclR family acetate operon transcriptional repressor
MREHLVEIRRLGYAVDDEERIEGVRCAASPIFNHAGTVVGAISVAAPLQRTPPERLRQLGEDAKQTAEAISRQLGFMGPNLSANAKESQLVGAIRGV